MSAENIAKVVADIRAGRIVMSPTAVDSVIPQDPAIDVRERLEKLQEIDSVRANVSPVIDADRFFHQIMTDKRGTRPYDCNMMPVWENALIGYENGYGNVSVACVVCYDRTNEWWETENEVDWDAVKYVYYISAYVGGRSGDGVPAATMGPMFMWRVAVYDDGSIADILWQNVLNLQNRDMFLHTMVCVLLSYDLGNCVNVELAEPRRPRAERRRLEREGVRVSEIHVRPISKSYRNNKSGDQPLSPGVPLSSVRGHHAHYGPRYGRKLLFGKYEGRFWIPQHARGDESLGVIDQGYVVEPTSD